MKYADYWMKHHAEVHYEMMQVEYLTPKSQLDANRNLVQATINKMSASRAGARFTRIGMSYLKQYQIMDR